MSNAIIVDNYCYVKTLKNWRDQEKYFDELGLKEIE